MTIAQHAAKKVAMPAAGRLTIATHSGAFHADESLACAMLQLLPTYRDARIVRTRAPDVLAEADIVVDVGGEYVPERHRYDHHQRGFAETFDPKHSTKLSSAGLVYRHFGRSVLAQILGWEAEHPALPMLYDRVYDTVIEGYDGNDNGISRYPADVKPRFQDSSSIYAQVSRLNPWWNEDAASVNVEERFAQAVRLTGEDFVRRVRYLGLAWLPAREVVAGALDQRFQLHPSGHILALRSQCPWKEHLHTLEEEQAIPEASKPLYVLYEDGTAKQWRIQAVALTPDSFESRKALPEPWRGVRDEQLSTLTGIAGGVFVHASGFIGGNATYEGALAMAKAALAFGVEA